MLLNLRQQFLFSMVLIETRLFGGAEKARMDFNTYNRGTSDDATKKGAKKGHNLHRKNMKWWKIILEGVPPPTIVNLFPSTIFYDDKKHNKKKSLDIDGTKVPFRLNYVTTKTKRAKPKAQLSSIKCEVRRRRRWAGMPRSQLAWAHRAESGGNWVVTMHWSPGSAFRPRWLNKVNWRIHYCFSKWQE